MKKEPGTTDKSVGSNKDLLLSLIKRFNEDTERWKDQRPPLNVTRDRVRFWFHIRELKKFFKK